MRKKIRKAYTKEFKLEALKLLENSGKSAAELERELGIGKSNLSRWKRECQEAEEQAFPGQGRVSAEEQRLRELERENAILRQERAILKKAIAIFTQASE